MSMSSIRESSPFPVGVHVVSPDTQAEQERYRSPFLRVLKFGTIGLLIIAIGWAVCLYEAFSETAGIVKTIGHDTVLSIMSAERITALLADANANFANSLLTGDGVNGPSMTHYREDMREAQDDIRSAAQNVTFGEEENAPLRTIMAELAEYDRLVGVAVGQAADGRKSVEWEAVDSLMHWTILPAARALDRVNFEHLDEGYRRHRTIKHQLLIGIVGLSLALLAALMGFQLAMFRFTSRLVNLPLAAATFVAVMFSGFAVWDIRKANDEIVVAKSDAFDSIHALSKAKAIASDANAAESFFLLSHGNAARQARFQSAFFARSRALVDGSSDDAITAANSGSRFSGLLGDELSNITFAGERKVAMETLKRWVQYVGIDRKIRELDASDHLADAIKMNVGTGEGQSNHAFAKFEEALDATLDINQAAFDRAIRMSEKRINIGTYAELAAAWLVASALIALGGWLRMKEYEF
jgi:hypothetical protein